MSEKKPVRKQQALEKLGDVLDFESYSWLMMQHPRIGKALEIAVAAGATTDDVRRLSWARTQRPEIVQRIANAARYLETIEEE